MDKLIVNGKVVGELMDGTLIKRGKQVVKMDIFNGFGMPQSAIHDPRVERVELHTDDKIYKAGVGLFIEKGIPYHRPPYEPQYILTVNYFSVKDSHQLEII